MPDAVELTGEHLAIADVWDVAVAGRPAVLGETGRTRAAAARAFLEAQVGDHTYGVNTGFGRFVSQAIPPEQAADLQLRLLRSHACGVGDPYPDEVVRAAMLLRANTLAKGFSGSARRDDRAPPRRARVGDRAPRAVTRLGRGERRSRSSRAPRPAARGEGEATVDGRRVSGAEALAAVGLSPITLEAKEGLSLINGTQFMTAMASLALVRAQRLARVADVACAMAVEALQGTPTSFHPAIHAARPLAGQQRSAATLRALLDGSAIVESHRWCDKVQDAYSLRCAPQVHGASRDLLDHVERTVAVELNAATDNPLVLLEEELIVSNGNFHGQPIAIGLDCIAIACAELASISERRTERLVNPSLSDGLPPFLVAREEGLNSGFMIPQYVAAALVSENKSLSHPASVDSIPTSAGQEDHVSMGNGAGLKALQVVANAERVLAIELLAGAQAVEFLAPLEPGRGVGAARAFVRTLSERVREDRSLSADIERVASAIRDGSLLDAVAVEVAEVNA